MGTSASKRSPCKEDFRALTKKIRILQKEMSELVKLKEKESVDNEREELVFLFMEAEWKQERKRFKEEVKRLRMMLEEKDEKIRGMEKILGSDFWMEQMKDERAYRDEAVEKWKKLYLAIKIELDNLIQTANGDGLFWRIENEDKMDELKTELKAKDEVIETLKTELAAVEAKEVNSKREVEILRQSIRITGANKKKVTRGLGRCRQTKQLYQYW